MKPLNKDAIQNFINKNAPEYDVAYFNRAFNRYNATHDEMDENSEFIKAEFKQFKEDANRVTETFFKGLRDYVRHNYNGDPLNDYLYFEINSTYANNLPGIMKKLTNKKKVDQDSAAVKDVIALFSEIMPIADTVKMAKENIVVKKKEKVEQETQAYLKEKMLLNHSDVVKTRNLLNETMNDTKESIKGILVDGYEATVDKLKEAFNGNEPVGYTEFKKWMKENNLHMGIVALFAERKSNDMNTFLLNYKSDADIKQTIDECAEREVTEMIDKFVFKNTSKVAVVLNNKDNLKEITVSPYNVRNGLIESTVFFKFRDGASFALDSNVEYAYSKNNLLFLRFPSRFKNIRLANGEPMKYPSEENMINVFSVENSPKKTKKLTP